MADSLDNAVLAFTGMRLPQADTRMMWALASILDAYGDQVINGLSQDLRELVRSVQASVGGSPGRKFVDQTSRFVIDPPHLLPQGGLLLKSGAKGLDSTALEMDYMRTQGITMFAFMMAQILEALAEGFFGIGIAIALAEYYRWYLRTVLIFLASRVELRVLLMQMLFMPGSSLIAMIDQIVDGRRKGVDTKELGRMTLHALVGTATTLVSLPFMSKATTAFDDFLKKVGVAGGVDNFAAGLTNASLWSIIQETSAEFLGSGLVDGKWQVNVSAVWSAVAEAAGEFLGNRAGRAGRGLLGGPNVNPNTADPTSAGGAGLGVGTGLGTGVGTGLGAGVGVGTGLGVNPGPGPAVGPDPGPSAGPSAGTASGPAPGPERAGVPDPNGLIPSDANASSIGEPDGRSVTSDPAARSVTGLFGDEVPDPAVLPAGTGGNAELKGGTGDPSVLPDGDRPAVGGPEAGSGVRGDASPPDGAGLVAVVPDTGRDGSPGPVPDNPGSPAPLPPSGDPDAGAGVPPPDPNTLSGPPAGDLPSGPPSDPPDPPDPGTGWAPSPEGRAAIEPSTPTGTVAGAGGDGLVLPGDPAGPDPGHPGTVDPAGSLAVNESAGPDGVIPDASAATPTPSPLAGQPTPTPPVPPVPPVLAPVVPLTASAPALPQAAGLQASLPAASPPVTSPPVTLPPVTSLPAASLPAASAPSGPSASGPQPLGQWATPAIEAPASLGASAAEPDGTAVLAMAPREGEVLEPRPPEDLAPEMTAMLRGDAPGRGEPTTAAYWINLVRSVRNHFGDPDLFGRFTDDQIRAEYQRQVAAPGGAKRTERHLVERTAWVLATGRPPGLPGGARPGEQPAGGSSTQGQNEPTGEPSSAVRTGPSVSRGGLDAVRFTMVVPEGRRSFGGRDPEFLLLGRFADQVHHEVVARLRDGRSPVRVILEIAQGGGWFQSGPDSAATELADLVRSQLRSFLGRGWSQVGLPVEVVEIEVRASARPASRNPRQISGRLTTADSAGEAGGGSAVAGGSVGAGPAGAWRGRYTVEADPRRGVVHAPGAPESAVVAGTVVSPPGVVTVVLPRNARGELGLPRRGTVDGAPDRLSVAVFRELLAEAGWRGGPVQLWAPPVSGPGQGWPLLAAQMQIFGEALNTEIWLPEHGSGQQFASGSMRVSAGRGWRVLGAHALPGPVPGGAVRPPVWLESAAEGVLAPAAGRRPVRWQGGAAWMTLPEYLDLRSHPSRPGEARTGFFEIVDSAGDGPFGGMRPDSVEAVRRVLRGVGYRPGQDLRIWTRHGIGDWQPLLDRLARAENIEIVVPAEDTVAVEADGGVAWSGEPRPVGPDGTVGSWQVTGPLGRLDLGGRGSGGQLDQAGRGPRGGLARARGARAAAGGSSAPRRFDARFAADPAGGPAGGPVPPVTDAAGRRWPAGAVAWVSTNPTGLGAPTPELVRARGGSLSPYSRPYLGGVLGVELPVLADGRLGVGLGNGDARTFDPAEVAGAARLLASRGVELVVLWAQPPAGAAEYGRFLNDVGALATEFDTPVIHLIRGAGMSPVHDSDSSPGLGPLPGPRAGLAFAYPDRTADDPPPLVVRIGPGGALVRRRDLGPELGVYGDGLLLFGARDQGESTLPSHLDSVMRTMRAGPGRLPLVAVHTVRGYPSWRPDRLVPLTADEVLRPLRTRRAPATPVRLVASAEPAEENTLDTFALWMSRGYEEQPVFLGRGARFDPVLADFVAARWLPHLLPSAVRRPGEYTRDSATGQLVPTGHPFEPAETSAWEWYVRGAQVSELSVRPLADGDGVYGLDLRPPSERETVPLRRPGAFLVVADGGLGVVSGHRGGLPIRIPAEQLAAVIAAHRPAGAAAGVGVGAIDPVHLAVGGLTRPAGSALFDPGYPALLGAELGQPVFATSDPEPHAASVTWREAPAIRARTLPEGLGAGLDLTQGTAWEPDTSEQVRQAVGAGRYPVLVGSDQDGRLTLATATGPRPTSPHALARLIAAAMAAHGLDPAVTPVELIVPGWAAAPGALAGTYATRKRRFAEETLTLITMLPVGSADVLGQAPPAYAEPEPAPEPAPAVTSSAAVSADALGQDPPAYAEFTRDAPPPAPETPQPDAGNPPTEADGSGSASPDVTTVVLPRDAQGTLGLPRRGGPPGGLDRPSVASPAEAPASLAAGPSVLPERLRSLSDADWRGVLQDVRNHFRHFGDPDLFTGFGDARIREEIEGQAVAPGGSQRTISQLVERTAHLLLTGRVPGLPGGTRPDEQPAGGSSSQARNEPAADLEAVADRVRLPAGVTGVFLPRLDSGELAVPGAVPGEDGGPRAPTAQELTERVAARGWRGGPLVVWAPAQGRPSEARRWEALANQLRPMAAELGTEIWFPARGARQDVTGDGRLRVTPGAGASRPAGGRLWEVVRPPVSLPPPAGTVVTPHWLDENDDGALAVADQYRPVRWRGGVLETDLQSYLNLRPRLRRLAAADTGFFEVAPSVQGIFSRPPNAGTVQGFVGKFERILNGFGYQQGQDIRIHFDGDRIAEWRPLLTQFAERFSIEIVIPAAGSSVPFLRAGGGDAATPAGEVRAIARNGDGGDWTVLGPLAAQHSRWQPEGGVVRPRQQNTVAVLPSGMWGFSSAGYVRGVVELQRRGAPQPTFFEAGGLLTARAPDGRVEFRSDRLDGTAASFSPAQLAGQLRALPAWQHRPIVVIPRRFYGRTGRPPVWDRDTEVAAWREVSSILGVAVFLPEARADDVSLSGRPTVHLADGSPGTWEDVSPPRPRPPAPPLPPAAGPAPSTGPGQTSRNEGAAASAAPPTVPVLPPPAPSPASVAAGREFVDVAWPAGGIFAIPADEVPPDQFVEGFTEFLTWLGYRGGRDIRDIRILGNGHVLAPWRGHLTQYSRLTGVEILVPAVGSVATAGGPVFQGRVTAVGVQGGAGRWDALTAAGSSRWMSVDGASVLRPDSAFARFGWGTHAVDPRRYAAGVAGLLTRRQTQPEVYEMVGVRVRRTGAGSPQFVVDLLDGALSELSVDQMAERLRVGGSWQRRALAVTPRALSTAAFPGEAVDWPLERAAWRAVGAALGVPVFLPSTDTAAVDLRGVPTVTGPGGRPSRWETVHTVPGEPMVPLATDLAGRLWRSDRPAWLEAAGGGLAAPSARLVTGRGGLLTAFDPGHPAGAGAFSLELSVLPAGELAVGLGDGSERRADLEEVAARIREAARRSEIAREIEARRVRDFLDGAAETTERDAVAEVVEGEDLGTRDAVGTVVLWSRPPADESAYDVFRQDVQRLADVLGRPVMYLRRGAVPLMSDDGTGGPPRTAPARAEDLLVAYPAGASTESAARRGGRPPGYQIARDGQLVQRWDNPDLDPEGLGVGVYSYGSLLFGRYAGGQPPVTVDEWMATSLARDPSGLPLVGVHAVDGAPSWRPDRLVPLSAEQVVSWLRAARTEGRPATPVRLFAASGGEPAAAFLGLAARIAELNENQPVFVARGVLFDHDLGGFVASEWVLVRGPAGGRVGGPVGFVGDSLTRQLVPAGHPFELPGHDPSEWYAAGMSPAGLDVRELRDGTGEYGVDLTGGGETPPPRIPGEYVVAARASWDGVLGGWVGGRLATPSGGRLSTPVFVPPEQLAALVRARPAAAGLPVRLIAHPELVTEEGRRGLTYEERLAAELGGEVRTAGTVNDIQVSTLPGDGGINLAAAGAPDGATDDHRWAVLAAGGFPVIVGSLPDGRLGLEAGDVTVASTPHGIARQISLQLASRGVDPAATQPWLVVVGPEEFADHGPRSADYAVRLARFVEETDRWFRTMPPAQSRPAGQPASAQPASAQPASAQPAPAPGAPGPVGLRWGLPPGAGLVEDSVTGRAADDSSAFAELDLSTSYTDGVEIRDLRVAVLADGRGRYGIDLRTGDSEEERMPAPPRDGRWFVVLADGGPEGVVGYRPDEQGVFQQVPLAPELLARLVEQQWGDSDAIAIVLVVDPDGPPRPPYRGIEHASLVSDVLPLPVFTPVWARADDGSATASWRPAPRVLRRDLPASLTSSGGPGLDLAGADRWDASAAGRAQAVLAGGGFPVVVESYPDGRLGLTTSDGPRPATPYVVAWSIARGMTERARDPLATPPWLIVVRPSVPEGGTPPPAEYGRRLEWFVQEMHRDLVTIAGHWSAEGGPPALHPPEPAAVAPREADPAGWYTSGTRISDLRIWPLVDGEGLYGIDLTGGHAEVSPPRRPGQFTVLVEGGPAGAVGYRPAARPVALPAEQLAAMLDFLWAGSGETFGDVRLVLTRSDADGGPYHGVHYAVRVGAELPDVPVLATTLAAESTGGDGAWRVPEVLAGSAVRGGLNLASLVVDEATRRRIEAAAARFRLPVVVESHPDGRLGLVVLSDGAAVSLAATPHDVARQIVLALAADADRRHPGGQAARPGTALSGTWTVDVVTFPLVGFLPGDPRAGGYEERVARFVEETTALVRSLPFARAELLPEEAEALRWTRDALRDVRLALRGDPVFVGGQPATAALPEPDSAPGRTEAPRDPYLPRASGPSPRLPSVPGPAPAPGPAAGLPSVPGLPSAPGLPPGHGVVFAGELAEIAGQLDPVPNVTTVLWPRLAGGELAAAGPAEAAGPAPLSDDAFAQLLRAAGWQGGPVQLWAPPQPGSPAEAGTRWDALRAQARAFAEHLGTEIWLPARNGRQEMTDGRLRVVSDSGVTWEVVAPRAQAGGLSAGIPRGAVVAPRWLAPAPDGTLVSARGGAPVRWHSGLASVTLPEFLRWRPAFHQLAAVDTGLFDVLLPRSQGGLGVVSPEAGPAADRSPADRSPADWSSGQASARPPADQRDLEAFLSAHGWRPGQDVRIWTPDGPGRSRSTVADLARGLGVEVIVLAAGSEVAVGGDGGVLSDGQVRARDRAGRPGRWSALGPLADLGLSRWVSDAQGAVRPRPGDAVIEQPGRVTFTDPSTFAAQAPGLFAPGHRQPVRRDDVFEVRGARVRTDQGGRPAFEVSAFDGTTRTIPPDRMPDLLYRHGWRDHEVPLAVTPLGQSAQVRDRNLELRAWAEVGAAAGAFVFAPAADGGSPHEVDSLTLRVETGDGGSAPGRWKVVFAPGRLAVPLVTDPVGGLRPPREAAWLRMADNGLAAPTGAMAARHWTRYTSDDLGYPSGAGVFALDLPVRAGGRLGVTLGDGTVVEAPLDEIVTAAHRRARGTITEVVLWSVPPADADAHAVFTAHVAELANRWRRPVAHVRRHTDPLATRFAPGSALGPSGREPAERPAAAELVFTYPDQPVTPPPTYLAVAAGPAAPRYPGPGGVIDAWPVGPARVMPVPQWVPYDGDGLVTAVLHSAALQHPGSAPADLYGLLVQAPGPVAAAVRFFLDGPRAPAGLDITGVDRLTADRAAIADALRLHLLWLGSDSVSASGRLGDPTVAVHDAGPESVVGRHLALWPSRGLGHWPRGTPFPAPLPGEPRPPADETDETVSRAFDILSGISAGTWPAGGPAGTPTSLSAESSPDAMDIDGDVLDGVSAGTWPWPAAGTPSPLSPEPAYESPDISDLMDLDADAITPAPSAADVLVTGSGLYAVDRRQPDRMRSEWAGDGRRRDDVFEVGGLLVRGDDHGGVEFVVDRPDGPPHVLPPERMPAFLRAHGWNRQPIAVIPRRFLFGDSSLEWDPVLEARAWAEAGSADGDMSVFAPEPGTTEVDLSDHPALRGAFGDAGRWELVAGPEGRQPPLGTDAAGRLWPPGEVMWLRAGPGGLGAPSAEVVRRRGGRPEAFFRPYAPESSALGLELAVLDDGRLGVGLGDGGTRPFDPAEVVERSEAERPDEIATVVLWSQPPADEGRYAVFQDDVRRLATEFGAPVIQVGRGVEPSPVNNSASGGRGPLPAPRDDLVVIRPDGTEESGAAVPSLIDDDGLFVGLNAGAAADAAWLAYRVAERDFSLAQARYHQLHPDSRGDRGEGTSATGAGGGKAPATPAQLQAGLDLDGAAARLREAQDGLDRLGLDAEALRAADQNALRLSLLERPRLPGGARPTDTREPGAAGPVTAGDQTEEGLPVRGPHGVRLGALEIDVSAGTATLTRPDGIVEEFAYRPLEGGGHQITDRLDGSWRRFDVGGDLIGLRLDVDTRGGAPAGFLEIDLPASTAILTRDGIVEEFAYRPLEGGGHQITDRLDGSWRRFDVGGDLIGLRLDVDTRGGAPAGFLEIDLPASTAILTRDGIVEEFAYRRLEGGHRITDPLDRSWRDFDDSGALIAERLGTQDAHGDDFGYLVVDHVTRGGFHTDLGGPDRRWDMQVTDGESLSLTSPDGSLHRFTADGVLQEENIFLLDLAGRNLRRSLFVRRDDDGNDVLILTHWIAGNLEEVPNVQVSREPGVGFRITDTGFSGHRGDFQIIDHAGDLWSESIRIVDGGPRDSAPLGDAYVVDYEADTWVRVAVGPGPGGGQPEAAPAAAPDAPLRRYGGRGIVVVEWDGTLRLFGAAGAAVYSREPLNSRTYPVRTVETFQRADGRRHWIEWDGHGGGLLGRHAREGARVYSDLAEGRLWWDEQGLFGKVREYRQTADGGLIRADRLADESWRWYRFNRHGTLTHEGVREKTWNRNWEDVLVTPDGDRLVPHRYSSALNLLSRALHYQENRIVLDEESGGYRLDENYQKFSPQLKDVGSLEVIEDGHRLKTRRWAEQRPPDVLWKTPESIPGFFDRTAARLFGLWPFSWLFESSLGAVDFPNPGWIMGDSRFQVFKWTETGADGVEVSTGVRTVTPDGAFSDFTRGGLFVRGMIRLENGNTVEIGRAADRGWAALEGAEPNPGARTLDWRELDKEKLMVRSGRRTFAADGKRWVDTVSDIGENRIVDTVSDIGENRIVDTVSDIGENRIYVPRGFRIVRWADRQGNVITVHRPHARPEPEQPYDPRVIRIVTRNTMGQIVGRADLWAPAAPNPVQPGMIEVSAHGDPQTGEWSWTDSIGGSGTRISGRNERWTGAWDDSFHDLRTGDDGSVERIRDFRSLDKGRSLAAQRMSDGTWHSEIRDTEGSPVPGSAARRFWLHPDAQWLPTVPRGVRPQRWEDRDGDGNILRELAHGRVRQYDPPRPPDRPVGWGTWKEFDYGAVFRQRRDLGDGVFRESESFHKQWRETDVDGRLLRYRSLSGTVWERSPLNRWSIQHSNFTLVGREFEYRGRMSELRGKNRMWRETNRLQYKAVDGLVGEFVGSVRKIAQKASLDFAQELVIDFAAQVMVAAMFNRGKLTEPDYLRALVGAAIGSFLKTANSAYHDWQGGGLKGFKDGLANVDGGKDYNRNPYNQDKHWDNEWAGTENPPRWRTIGYDYLQTTLLMGFVAAFVATTVNAAAFGLPKDFIPLSGARAARAGAWGGAGAVGVALAFGLARTLLHSAGSGRVFHRGGLSDIIISFIERGFERALGTYLTLRALNLLPQQNVQPPPTAASPARF
ncbi:hypothetical protein [Parafrankia elaeagni]|uniref:hypothetical protein n=1 Tax=Parafrankia elaeagni TaxID=222534 RepID=UPI0003A778AD|nr:hypothetical protein [Parafrankia elaeagni]